MAAGQLASAPDHRALSHWETARKVPSLRLLTAYLRALGLDFHALRDALDQVDGSAGRTSSPAKSTAWHSPSLETVAESRAAGSAGRHLAGGRGSQRGVDGSGAAT